MDILSKITIIIYWSHHHSESYHKTGNAVVIVTATEKTAISVVMVTKTERTAIFIGMVTITMNTVAIVVMVATMNRNYHFCINNNNGYKNSITIIFVSRTW